MIRKSIFCAAFVVAALPAIAQDACESPNPERKFQKIDFSDGSTVNIVERTTTQLTYTADTSQGRRITTTSYGGLVTLESATQGAKNIFEWDRDLAGLFPLEAGKTFQASARMTNSQTSQQQTLSLDLKVLDSGLFRVSGCDYPYIKIETRMALNGSVQSVLTRYYHAASMVTLRTTMEPVASGQKTVEFIATRAE